MNIFLDSTLQLVTEWNYCFVTDFNHYEKSKGTWKKLNSVETIRKRLFSERIKKNCSDSLPYFISSFNEYLETEDTWQRYVALQRKHLVHSHLLVAYQKPIQCQL